MTELYYPKTNVRVRIGDKVRWYDDKELSEVVFVVSTGECRADHFDSMEWFKSEFKTGIMINTPSAGLVLEDEDCSSITLIQSAINNI